LHSGASQSAAAHLCAEDINWPARTIAYTRKKLAHRDPAAVRPALIRFGNEVAELLSRRPKSGPLFPYLRTVRAGDRATEFKQRCDGLGIKGVSLHSYRYTWAERALKCGYPLRFAQEALGHNSKAVHQSYAKNAEVIVPSLADWENHWKQQQEQQKPTALPNPTVPLPQPPSEEDSGDEAPSGLGAA
jgi:integrase